MQKKISDIIPDACRQCAPNSPINRTTDLSNDTIRRLKFRFAEVAYSKVSDSFLFRENLKDVYNDIFCWCLMLDSGRLDPSKGLWLYGNIGTGKSTMLEIVKAFCREVRPPKTDGNPYSFRISNAVDVCSDFQANGFIGIETYVQSDWQAFDELGSEPKFVGYYGTPQNVFQYILQRRYDRRHSSTTHITTNLSPAQIAERYSERIYDRCKEMFNFVEFTGKTFRK